MQNDANKPKVANEFFWDMINMSKWIIYETWYNKSLRKTEFILYIMM